MTIRVFSAIHFSSLFLDWTTWASFHKLPLLPRLGTRPLRLDLICRVLVSVPHLHEDCHCKHPRTAHSGTAVYEDMLSRLDFSGNRLRVFQNFGA